jgi:prepilin-type N-terminal cleavage/methylation domain-containing protein
MKSARRRWENPGRMRGQGRRGWPAPKPSAHVPNPHGQEWRSAFTLMELLVVVGIIGLLLALLLPALGGAMERARETRCSNNMRNLTLAAFNYEHDYEKLPDADYWTPVGNYDYCSLMTVTNSVFFDYVREYESYVCPTFKRIAPRPNAVRSYSMNYSVSDRRNEPLADILMPSLRKVPAPADLVLFAEENPYVIPLTPAYGNGMNDGRLVWVNSTDSIGTFHRKKSCGLSFLDGHVIRYEHQSNWVNMFDPRPYRR